MDNYDPPRETRALSATVYAATDVHPETVALDASSLRDSTRAVYLLDDGATVRPHYVAGWDKAGMLWLQPFPLSQGTRPDNGRPVDMSSWAIGPRRCYHVKIVGE